MKRNKIAFSVVDLILLILVLACFLSAVFQNQIRSFFGQEEGETVEVTFLIEHVTQKGKNHPVAGEKLVLTESQRALGTLLSVSESSDLYQSIRNPEEQISIRTLTCKVQTKAVSEDRGYFVGEVLLKPGAQFAAETPSASFVMMVTMVKPVEATDQ